MHPAPLFSASHLAIPTSLVTDISTPASEHDDAGEFAEMAVELHECIVWESGVTFEHRLPDAYFSEGSTAHCQDH